MLIQINGEARDVPDKITLTELIKHLSLAPERLAIELNQEVVRRARDVVGPDFPIVYHFVGGG